MNPVIPKTVRVICSSSRYLSSFENASLSCISNHSGFVREALKLHHLQPMALPVRYKGKNKVRKDSAKIFSLTEELRQTIGVEDMIHEYSDILERFEEDLCRKLCLKLTPEMFYTIPIPNEHLQLGDVASIISQTVHSTAIQPTSQILIDLSGRPDLVPAAKAAISQYLSSDSEASDVKKRKTNSSYSDLIQDVDQTQFTIRFRTIVTGDVRSRDMLHRTKKDMDKIYQKFSKSITTNKSVSEDDKRAANEYLKNTVKAQHSKAEQVWKAKEQELLCDQM